MHELNPYFTAPEPTERIWRYVDFTKFVSMLEAKALFFACVEYLEDKFEGSYSRPFLPPNVTLDPRGLDEYIEALSKMRRFQPKIMRPSMFVNCWHLSEHESAAMWKTYLSSKEGVAVSSTYQRLADSVKSAPEKIYIGKVRYLDYEKDYIETANAYDPFLSKRKSFEYERELRALHWDLFTFGSLASSYGTGTAARTPPVLLPGKQIAVDLETLIDVVYVAPTAPAWFHNLVEGVLKRYGLDKPVKQSDLAKDPLS